MTLPPSPPGVSWFQRRNKMENDSFDLIREFKNNPMFAREFMDIHRSFSPWQKFVIELKYFLRTRFGI